MQSLQEPRIASRSWVEAVSVWPLEADDLEIAARWLAEDRNGRWLDFGTVTAPSPLALRVMAGRDAHSIFVYGPPDEHRPVGLVALGNIQPRFGTAEAWCVLGEKEYGPRDLTVRAAAFLLEHAFGTEGLTCVYAWTAEVNRGGRRLLQRLGFREAGRLRSSHRIDGRTCDRIWFDLLADEYDGYGELQ